MKKFIRWSSQHRLVRLCLLGAFFLFLAVKIVNSIDYRNSDFFSFWLAGHMMWTGQDPYFTNDWIQGHNEFGATWISDPRFLYPLPLAFLFAPLGLLPLYYAFIVWIFLLESMISFSAFSLINLGENPKKAHFLVPVLISIAIFRPAFIAVLNGQISGWLLFVMVSVILLWNKNSNSLGGGGTPNSRCPKTEYWNSSHCPNFNLATCQQEIQCPCWNCYFWYYAYLDWNRNQAKLGCRIPFHWKRQTISSLWILSHTLGISRSDSKV